MQTNEKSYKMLG